MRARSWIAIGLVVLLAAVAGLTIAHGRGFMLGVGPTGGITGQYLTFSCPAGCAGTVNVASGTFTVTAVNGTFNGTQTVTITAPSGTFAGGCVGTTSCTATPTVGASSFTFTYTPTATGALTLAMTNSLARPEIPTSVTYTSNPAGGTAALVLLIP